MTMPILYDSVYSLLTEKWLSTDYNLNWQIIDMMTVDNLYDSVIILSTDKQLTVTVYWPVWAESIECHQTAAVSPAGP